VAGITSDLWVEPERFRLELESFGLFSALDACCQIFHFNYSLYIMATLLALTNRAVSYFRKSNNELNNSETNSEMSTDDNEAVKGYEVVESEMQLCSVDDVDERL
jgi:hypothetical protein